MPGWDSVQCPISAEELYLLYWYELLSSQEIADKLKPIEPRATHGRVLRWMKSADIPRRSYKAAGKIAFPRYHNLDEWREITRRAGKHKKPNFRPTPAHLAGLKLGRAAAERTYQARRVTVKCAYPPCQKEMVKSPSRVHEYNYCCRTHQGNDLRRRTSLSGRKQEDNFLGKKGQSQCGH